jgi:hypothetical protein
VGFGVAIASFGTFTAGDTGITLTISPSVATANRRACCSLAQGSSACFGWRERRGAGTWGRVGGLNSIVELKPFQPFGQAASKPFQEGIGVRKSFAVTS